MLWELTEDLAKKPHRRPGQEARACSGRRDVVSQAPKDSKGRASGCHLNLENCLLEFS